MFWLYDSRQVLLYTPVTLQGVVRSSMSGPSAIYVGTDAWQYAWNGRIVDPRFDVGMSTYLTDPRNVMRKIGSTPLYD